MYFVSKNNAIPTLFSDETKNLLFYLIHQGKEIRFEAMYDAFVDLQVAQGEMDEIAAIFAKTESWDELPPELLAMWKARDADRKPYSYLPSGFLSYNPPLLDFKTDFTKIN
jgi:hypothetical protein